MTAAAATATATAATPTAKRTAIGRGAGPKGGMSGTNPRAQCVVHVSMDWPNADVNALSSGAVERQNCANRSRPISRTSDARILFVVGVLHGGAAAPQAAGGASGSVERHVREDHVQWLALPPRARWWS